MTKISVPVKYHALDKGYALTRKLSQILLFVMLLFLPIFSLERLHLQLYVNFCAIKYSFLIKNSQRKSKGLDFTFEYMTCA